MHSARPIAALCLALAALAAQAGELYKSVDAQGRITFSDVPVNGAVTVQRLAMSESVKPDEAKAGPVYLALADSFDEAVTQANAKVDMAERALAQARSGLLQHDPLSLGSPRLSGADAQRLEFFKRDVNSARRNLLRVLQQRNALAQRPLA